MIVAGSTYRIISDQIGSTRLVVNVGDGTVVQRTDYDEFGNVVLSNITSGWEPLPFGFAGGLYDRDTGLIRFGSRDYDPAVGRWLAKDPIGLEGGVNLYTYVHNNPVNRVDLTGLVQTLVETDEENALADDLAATEASSEQTAIEVENVARPGKAQRAQGAHS